MVYTVDDFIRALEKLLSTSDQPYYDQPYYQDTAWMPALASVLVKAYQEHYWLLLDGDALSWGLTTERRSVQEYQLSVEVPRLTERMCRLLTEDKLPASAVIDIPALRDQLITSVRLAFQQKFGQP